MQASTLTEYLQRYGDALIEKVEQASKPLLGEFVRPNIKLLREPMDAQWLRIMAIVEAWKANRRGVLLSAQMGTGKAQPLSAKVLTPRGFVKMGDLKIGDTIVDPDGGTAYVEGIYPQGEKPVFEVMFSDGSKTECCEEHLWLLQNPEERFLGKPGKVVSLSEVMKSGIEQPNGNRKWFLPEMVPFDSGDKELPVDPYVMGLLLGDGGLSQRTPYFTSTDQELVSAVNSEIQNLGVGMSVKKVGKYGYRLSRARKLGATNPLTDVLRRFSLDGVLSHTKFIPEIYMQAGLRQKIALLQGLIDSDGYLDRASIEYTTVSKTMAGQVASLVRSVGGCCRTVLKKTTFTYKGEKKAGRIAYRLHIKLPNEIEPSRLSRKLKKRRERSKYKPCRSIASITEVGRKECQCIRVSSKRRLYITDDHIVTHNTIKSIVATHVHANGKPYRAVIVCPPHLQRKWVREIQITIPEARCRIVEHFSEILEVVGTKPAWPSFWIMSGNKAKLATKWRPAFVKKRTGLLHCPNCDAEIMRKMKENGADVWVPAQPYDLEKKQSRCTSCKEALYQWTREPNRWPIANIIHRQARGMFKYLIVDESHQSKGERTAAGLSIGRLAASIPYKVALTGTLLNGYADSVFPIGWRLFPRLMKKVGVDWGDTMGFTKRYGRVETIISYKDEESYANKQSRGGGKSTTVRIKPGIVPNLYGDCLMENSVFCSLADLGLELPNLTEILHPVAMDPEQAEAYDQLEDDIRSTMKQLIAMGSKAAIAILLNTLNGWPDHPYGYTSIGYKTEDGSWRHVAEPPQLSAETIRPKERKLVEVAKDAVSRGRQVWVYCEMTVNRDVQPRLKSLLEDAGLRVKILRANTVSTVEREEWIRQNADCDVVISNPMLVETGIDLFDRGRAYNFSSLVFYQTGYKLDTLRQAAARSHRIGQWLDCETNFLFYDQTMQASCVRLMSQKTIAAKAVEGNFSQTALTAMTEGEGSVAMLLAQKLVTDTRPDRIAARTLDERAKDIAMAVRQIEAAKRPIQATEPTTGYKLTPARQKQWQEFGNQIRVNLECNRKLAVRQIRTLQKSLDNLPAAERQVAESVVGWADLATESGALLSAC